MLSPSLVETLGDSLTFVMNDRKRCHDRFILRLCCQLCRYYKELTNNKIVALENLLYDRQFKIIKEKQRPSLQPAVPAMCNVRRKRPAKGEPLPADHG